MVYKLTQKHFDEMTVDKELEGSGKQAIIFSMIDSRNTKYLFWKVETKGGKISFLDRSYFLVPNITQDELDFFSPHSMKQFDQQHRVTVVEFNDDWIKHYSASHWLKEHNYKDIQEALA